MQSLEQASPARSSLKGYKLAVKDHKRNILLKYKNNKKNYRSQMFLQTINPEKTTIQQLNSSIQPTQQRTHKSKYNLHTLHSSQLYNQIEDQISDYNYVQNSGRRMEEYLGVVFKKVQQDTDKIVKALSMQKDQRAQSKSRNHQPLNVNFIKRLKLNSLKLRIKRERADVSSSAAEKRIDVNLTQAQLILQKIKKTQEFIKSHNKSEQLQLQLQKTQQRLNKTQKIGTDNLKKRMSPSRRRFSEPKH